MSSEQEWRNLTLKAAGISLIDCDHKTPTAVADGYPYIAIPQLKDGHITLDGVRRISSEDYKEWTKKLEPQEDDVIVVRRCNSGQSAHVPAGLKCASERRPIAQGLRHAQHIRRDEHRIGHRAKRHHAAHMLAAQSLAQHKSVLRANGHDQTRAKGL